MNWWCTKIFLPSCLLLLWSCASNVTVSGRVAMRGNEPFAYISIATADIVYKLEGELAEEIRQKFQGRTVTLKGKVLPNSQSSQNAKNILELPKLQVLAIVAVD